MFEQAFDTFRKTSESCLQAQQDMYKFWAQQWSNPANVGEFSTDWHRSLAKKWSDFTTDSLRKHRESLDAVYRSGIQLVEESLRLSESKSPDEYRRGVEEVWRKAIASYKDQAESQFRDYQKGFEKLFELTPKVKV